MMNGSNENKINRCLRYAAAVTGVVVFLTSLMFTSWNESNLVAKATSSASARDNLHGISCDVIDSRNEGLLVHAACNISNFKSFQGFPGLVRFSQSQLMGIRLEQNVEVYEWQEVYISGVAKNVVGGAATVATTRTYALRWAAEFVDAASFRPGCAEANAGKPCVNVDPAGQPWWAGGPRALGTSTAAAADGLRLGPFDLPSALAAQIGGGAVLEPSCDLRCPKGMSVKGQFLYWRNLLDRDVAEDVDFPGDVRLQYTLYNASQAWVLAAQNGSTFAPWARPVGRHPLFLAGDGLRPASEAARLADPDAGAGAGAADAILAAAAARALALILAALGLFAAAGGCRVSGGPAGGGPTSGSLFGFSMLVATSCWSATVGASWLWYQPWIGSALLLTAAAAGIAAACCAGTRGCGRCDSRGCIGGSRPAAVAVRVDPGQLPLGEPLLGPGPACCPACGARQTAPAARLCAACGTPQ